MTDNWGFPKTKMPLTFSSLKQTKKGTERKFQPHILLGSSTLSSCNISPIAQSPLLGLQLAHLLKSGGKTEISGSQTLQTSEDPNSTELG